MSIVTVPASSGLLSDPFLLRYFMALPSARRVRPVEDPSHPCNPRRLAFLCEIASHPDDDNLRLVYADWLQDHGDEEDKLRAEFIRVQIADSLRDYVDVNEWVSPKVPELLNRSGGFYQRDLAFLGDGLLDYTTQRFVCYPYHVYHRGLIDEIGWPTPIHLQLWPKLRQVLPVTRLQASDDRILSMDTAAPWIALHGLRQVTLPAGPVATTTQLRVSQAAQAGLIDHIVFSFRDPYLTVNWFVDSSENAEPYIFRNTTSTKES